MPAGLGGWYGFGGFRVAAAVLISLLMPYMMERAWLFSSFWRPSRTGDTGAGCGIAVASELYASTCRWYSASFWAFDWYSS